ncbi:hypothetical protein D0865_11570 [Hortaea werneckii]|uniref:(S)-ureidoglycine aminohydrolase cupin domain-containing protein n=1 Tax=Hortaea werneckii TaxID=91943 RepID=A0A3M7BT57_HORWE|nr:hypothetical protein D0865_11570 [Hortaea werneckii]
MFGSLEVLLIFLLRQALRPLFLLAFSKGTHRLENLARNKSSLANLILSPEEHQNKALKMGSTGDSTTSVPLQYFAQQQQTFQPPLIANENAFLGDVVSSEKNNSSSPVSAGFYRLEKGTPLVYEYTYDEMKIILEGHFDISQKVRATKGDVFYFPKGAKITFTTDDYGLAFYTGQRKQGAA